MDTPRHKRRKWSEAVDSGRVLVIIQRTAGSTRYHGPSRTITTRKGQVGPERLVAMIEETTINEITESMNRLRAISTRLNKASDQASDLVAAVETFLNEDCSIGLPASLVIERKKDESDDLHTEWLTVSYERWDGRFRIVVELAHGFDPTEEVTIDLKKPWDQCPRDLKLQAFRKLPELLNEIADQAGWAVTNSEDAVEDMRAVFSELCKTTVEIGPSTEVLSD